MLRACLIAFLLLAAPAYGKPGDLDKSFGTGGRVTATPGSYGYGLANGVGLDRAGGIVTVGTADGVPFNGGFVAGPLLLRFTAAGREAGRTVFPIPDSSSEQRLALYPDGTAIVAASQIDLAGHYEQAIFRVLPDGTIDPAFGTGGVLALGQVGVGGIALDRAGRILVAYETSKAVVVQRLLPGGRPDTSYGDRGTATVATGARTVNALLVRRDGGAYVAATAPGDRSPHGAVFSLDARGRRVSGFVARFAFHDRHAADATGIAALAAGPHGTVLVARNDARVNRESLAAPYATVERLTRRGRRDRSFHPFRFMARNKDALIAAMTRDRHGRIVLAGASGLFELTQAVVLRLTPSGRPDRRFGTGGLVRKQLGAPLRDVSLIASRATSLAVDRRDRIVVAGETFDDAIEDREDVGRGYIALMRLRG